MDVSVLLAKVFGLLYIVVGIGVLTNKKHYRNMMKQFLGDATLMYFGGTMSFVVGVFIVLFHNIWLTGWELIITLIGWAAVLKGIAILVSPKSMNDFTKYWLDKIEIIGIFCITLGVILSYFGFITV